MTDNHKIGKIVYNTCFDSEEPAFEFQSNVSAFLQNELAPVIGDVCDQLELKNTHIFINSLELNLGNFSYEGHEDKIKEKLKKELFQALKEKISKLNKEPSEHGHIITKKKSALRHLIHFLRHGSLSWNAEIHDKNYIKKILVTTLDNYSAHFVQWLKTQGKQESIRKRIVYQFDTAHINKIIEKTDPVNAPFINAYSTDLIQTHKIKPKLPLSEKDFSNLTWEVILAYILTDNSSRFNRKSFVKYTLEKIATRNNITYIELVKAFAGSIPRLLKNQALKTEFPDLLIELKNEFSDPKKINGQQAANNKEKIKWLNELLDILKGETEFVDPKIIENLAAKYPAALIKLLEQVIATKTYAKNLPEILKEPQLIALTGILEPGERDFINSFSGFLDKLSDTQVNKAVFTGFFEKKWTIILNYILKEYGQIFNKTDFVRQTLKGLANKNESIYKKIVVALFPILKAHSEKNNDHQALLSVIKILNEDIILDTQKRAQPDYAIFQLFYHYELYDALIFYLNNGYTYGNMFSMPINGEMSNVLSEVEKASPALTSKFTEYLLDEKNIDLLLKNTDVNFIEATAFVLMKTFYSSSYHELARLKEIIKTKPKNTNEDIFWGQLIKRLVKNKGENTNKMLDEMEKNFSAVIVKKTLLPISSITIKTDILQQLANNLGTGETGLSYEECWYYLLGAHPSHAKQTLLYIASQPAMLEKLIKNTNNKLLFRLLSQLFPSVQIENFIRHFAGSFGITGQSGTDQTARLIWKTTFETLAFNGQRNETDLIKTLLHKTFTEIKDNSFKERAFIQLKKNIETAPGREKNDTLQVLEEIKNEITSQHKRKIPGSVVNARLKTETLAFLKGEHGKIFSQYQLFDYLLWYFKEDPEEAAEKLTELLNFSKTRQFWISSFPDNLLLRIIFLIYPRNIVSIRNSAEIIWNAVTSVMKQSGTKPKFGYWHYLIEALYFCNHKKHVENFCRLFTDQILDEISTHRKNAFLNQVITELNNAATPAKKEIFINTIQEIKKITGNTTLNGKEDLLIREKSPKEKQPPKEHKQSKYEEIREDPGEPLYVSNAGLVLAAPSLSPLFTLFKLIENNQFIHEEAAGRAVHLLQYMVDENTATPEFLLTLNKVLCGIDPEDPVPPGIEITEYEKACIEQLLKDMTYHWKEMRNTTINSFRQSFLQREGSLYHKEEWWELHVEPKPFDMLIDQIPWTYSTIRYPWMQMPLYVKWRE